VFNYTNGTDLCKTSYARDAMPVVRSPLPSTRCLSLTYLQIEMQIARQGYRLAQWLNVLFDGRTSTPRP